MVMDNNSILLGDYLADMTVGKLGINYSEGDPSVTLSIIGDNYSLDLIRETYLKKTNSYGLGKEEALDSFEELGLKYGL